MNPGPLMRRAIWEMGDDTFAAVVFGFVESGVSAVEEESESVAGAGLGDSEAGGDAGSFEGRGCGEGGDGADALRDLDGLFELRAWEDDEEFFASVACDDVGGSALGAESLSEGLEDLVAEGVSPGVVDAFEVVEVGEDDGEGEVGVVEDLELFVEGDVDVTAVGESGERVGFGDGAEAAAGAFEGE